MIKAMSTFLIILAIIFAIGYFVLTKTSSGNMMKDVLELQKAGNTVIARQGWQNSIRTLVVNFNGTPTLLLFDMTNKNLQFVYKDCTYDVISAEHIIAVTERFVERNGTVLELGLTIKLTDDRIITVDFVLRPGSVQDKRIIRLYQDAIAFNDMLNDIRSKYD
ncbi:MAG: hypothetical protein J6K70_02045 [Selenomonadales bacterium]|nr:hypothetical protein [Selenomonadales bacterium]